MPVKAGDWRPRNANYSSDEPMPLREAFIESNNRAAVGVQQRIGSRPILHLESNSVSTSYPDVASLALGTEASVAVATHRRLRGVPNGGYAVRPHGPRPSSDAHGVEVWKHDDATER